MWHSELGQFLTSSNSEETRLEAIPVLNVQPKEFSSQRRRSDTERREEDPESPFSFAPQRMRINTDHDFFEDGDIHRHLYLQDVATSVAVASQVPTVSEFRCHISGCHQLFNTLESYEQHYSSVHRHVCSSCRRHFPSNHLLDIHILEWHDSLFQIMAEKQNMYQCLVEGCSSKFKTNKERKDHLIKAHRYPPDFRFDRSKKTKSRLPRKVEQQQQSDVSMDVGCDAGMDCREPVARESMEPSQSQNPNNLEVVMLEHKPKSNYSSKVPTTVCFGAGSVRGFRGRRKK
ncbi:zinc finger protein 511 isoform X1 [Scleropages formosus]|uniref:Zinc finger protein 511 n=1 Tax=Scleropages formosus TaxID=113540 RepID=A0A8C9U3Y7_SCLFO|nr:zinc finger protein 511 isoform X1 [Scleropages formosus]